MEDIQDKDPAIIDLSSYSVSDACFWLLERLHIDKYVDNPYMFPFVSYVLTWNQAVPITSIVMAQSPYPNDIFSPIAAAMSYDELLCEDCKNIKGNIPPTVEILANDLYVNAGMNKNTTVELIKNGWTLIRGGMLLINESIFNSYNTPQGYKESVNQCNVIIRLLRETEKYGKRTVNIYAFGESGQRMASNLCSWFKSPIITLSKRAVTHPAAISRRFTDFSDPNCHMNDITFSKNFAKTLSNYVALLYTMPKRPTELDIKLQRQAEVFRTLHGHLEPYHDTTVEFINNIRDLREMDVINDENFKKMLDRVITSGNAFATRTGIAASLMAKMQGLTDQSIAGQVSKPAPSLSAVNPASESIMSSESQSRNKSITSSPVTFRKASRNVTPSIQESFDQVSSPPSITSVSTTAPSQRIVFRKQRGTPSGSVAGTQQSEISQSISSPTENTIQTRTVSAPVSAFFRKQTQNQSRDVSKSSEDRQTLKDSKTSGQKDDSLTLTKDLINQLSCVGAVVEMNKPDVDKDSDNMQDLDNIQHDISQKRIYNGIVEELVEGIKEDMKTYPDFDFSQWALNTEKPSKTFDICKERFEF